MSSSDSDSEADAARKARFAFALWEPPAAVEKPQVEAKPVVAKPVVIGFQQPDFREIPKSLDTLMAEDWSTQTKEDAFADSFVLSEASMTTKVTREEYYRRYKDLSVSGLKMSAKEKEEHRIVQQKGAKMLEKELEQQLMFVDVPGAISDGDMEAQVDDNGGIQMFVGAKTRITEVKAPEPLKIGLAASNRPVGWDLKRTKRIASDSDSDSDSEESRRRKVSMAGVVVDFSSNQGFTASTKDKIQEKSDHESEEIKKVPKSDNDMDVDDDTLEKSTEKRKKDKKDKKDKKHKKDKKEKKEKKHKKDKSSENSKKRKRDASNPEDSDSLG